MLFILFHLFIKTVEYSYKINKSGFVTVNFGMHQVAYSKYDQIDLLLNCIIVIY